MIETTNNLIFWTGYLVLIGIGLLIFIFSIHISIVLLKEIPQFWVKTFNIMLNRSLKKTTPEQFEEWLEEIINRYSDCKNDTTINKIEYLDKINKK